MKPVQPVRMSFMVFDVLESVDEGVGKERRGGRDMHNLSPLSPNELVFASDSINPRNTRT